jgi:hypothetical protein
MRAWPWEFVWESLWVALDMGKKANAEERRDAEDAEKGRGD